MFQNSNITKIQCPICGKNLRIKSPCCSDPRGYYICQCGYKKVKDNGEVNSVRHSSGSNDTIGV